MRMRDDCDGKWSRRRGHADFAERDRKGRGFPMAVRGISDESLPTQATPIAAKALELMHPIGADAVLLGSCFRPQASVNIGHHADA